MKAINHDGLTKALKKAARELREEAGERAELGYYTSACALSCKAAGIDKALYLIELGDHTIDV